PAAHARCDRRHHGHHGPDRPPGPDAPPARRVSAASAVVAHGVRKTYGEFPAVDGVDVEVPSGVCFGFLGPNGAGKTTLMKMIYGLARVDGGSLTVLGLDVTRERRALKARIGIVPQDDNLDREFTVRQNLVVQGGYFGLRRDAA